jgi:hypothetical protein
MVLVSLLTFVSAFYTSVGVASGDSKQEIDLISRTLASDKSKDHFYQTSEDQLSKLHAAGILPKHYTSRFDYVSYYRPKKAVYFHGAKLLYFEYEYLEEFIGCCVDDGFGLILQGKPNNEIVKFATDSGCKINEGDQAYLPYDINKEFKVRRIQIESVFELSCRANDAQ